MRLFYLFFLFGSVVHAAVLIDSPDFYLSVEGVSTVPTFSIDDSVEAEFSWSLAGQSFDDFPNQPVHFTSPSNILLSQVASAIGNFYQGFGFAVTASTPYPSKTFSESTLNPTSVSPPTTGPGDKFSPYLLTVYVSGMVAPLGLWGIAVCARFVRRGTSIGSGIGGTE